MKRNHYMCVGLSFRELGRSLPFFEVKYADIEEQNLGEWTQTNTLSGNMLTGFVL